MTDPVLPGPWWASKPFVLIILCFNFCPRDRPAQFHFVSSQQLELFLWWNIKYWLAELQAPELTPAAPLLQSPVRPLCETEMARFLPHLTAEPLLKKHSLILSVFFPPPASDNISDGTAGPADWLRLTASFIFISILYHIGISLLYLVIQPNHSKQLWHWMLARIQFSLLNYLCFS